MSFIISQWPLLVDYIHLNPVRNGIVKKAEDYIYSSAGAYVCNKNLLEIDLIEIESTIGYVGSW